MAITDKERQEAVEAVRWLRRCQDSSDVESRCWSCPYEGKNCTRLMREISAELIEDFVLNLRTKGSGSAQHQILPEAERIATWLWRCCEKDKRLKWCGQCPCNDGEHNCMDQLQRRAADVLEQLIKMS